MAGGTLTGPVYAAMCMRSLLLNARFAGIASGNAHEAIGGFEGGQLKLVIHACPIMSIIFLTTVQDHHKFAMHELAR
jgi:hypothetical protein